MSARIRSVSPRRFVLFAEFEAAMRSRPAQSPPASSEAVRAAERGEGNHPLLCARGDDHASLVDFAARIATTEGPVPVAVHPDGRYRFERPRADRLDAELGVALRLIDSALFPSRAPATDRPWLPLLDTSSPPSRADTISIGHHLREGHTADAALIERVVQGVIAGRHGAIWDPEPSAACYLYVDHLDADFGGYTEDGLWAMARGAACLGAAVRVGPHVDAFWRRPPVVVVRDAEALARELAALLDDRERLHALRVASWEWARDVASVEIGERRPKPGSMRRSNARASAPPRRGRPSGAPSPRRASPVR